jgi:hypothetical protein
MTAAAVFSVAGGGMSRLNDACGICGYWRCRCKTGSAADVFTAVYAGQGARLRRVVLAELRLGDQAVAAAGARELVAA